MLQTLDFTAPDDVLAPPSPAAAAKPAPAVAPAAPTAAPVVQTPAAAAPVAKAPPPAAPPADDKAQQIKREADVRQKLLAALQPRIEEELRAKLAPRIEQEIRPKLIAALRPSVEAEVRKALEKELAPRVELELKTRFAKTLVAQRAAEPIAPSVPDGPATPQPGSSDAVLEALPLPAFRVDAEGQCQFMSGAWARLTGHAAADALGKPLAACFEAGSQRAVAGLLRAVAAGTALRFEQQGYLTRAQDEPLWVEINVAPSMDAGGASVGVCGTIRDASEERRATVQAEADGVRLLLLVEHIHTGVVLEDADGNIQQANTALCDLLTLEAAPFSLEGTPVSELFELISTKLIAPEGYLTRVAQMREAGEDVKGDSFVLTDGRVIEQDYLAVSAGEQAAGRIWLYREIARKAPAAA
jgi:PAS domain S-box-containing protein